MSCPCGATSFVDKKAVSIVNFSIFIYIYICPLQKSGKSFGSKN